MDTKFKKIAVTLADSDNSDDIWDRFGQQPGASDSQRGSLGTSKSVGDLLIF